MTTLDRMRKEIEASLREQFEEALALTIKLQLDHECDEAIERWEAERGDEIEIELRDQFEDGLAEAIDAEVENLQDA
jgi:hypothetical protein